MKPPVLLFACLAAIGCAWPALGAEKAADRAARGREVALTVCAACHMVAKDQKIAPILRPRATSFAAMVRYKGLTADQLREFLRSPQHGHSPTRRKMPDLTLSEEYVDDVVAYILGLKERR